MMDPTLFCVFVALKASQRSSSGLQPAAAITTVCVCVRVGVCVCVFIKLHITAQSGPVILVILCHSHRSSQGEINDTCYENL